VDIESILQSLGLDLKDPETRRGALEAIEAILDSRNTGSSDQGGDFGSMSGDQEIEIDPDLLQPSIKSAPQGSQDDIDINDEDDVLKDLKFNDSDDEIDSNTSEAGNNSSESSEESDSTGADSSGESSDKNTAERNQPDRADSGETDEADINTEADEAEATNAPEETADEAEQEEAEGSEGTSADQEAANEGEDGDESDEAGTEADEDTDLEGEGAAADEGESDTEAEKEDEFDFDEDDFLDDELKNKFDDKEITSKHEARKIKRERTLQAAKQTLEDAKAKKKSPALIRELEKAIDALEALKEAVEKSLKDLSDEEFNMMVNRVFDAIDALGDSDLTYSSDEERQLKAKEIKADIENKQTQAELSAEDVAQIRAETQAIKAREKEAAKYQRRSSSSFKGFQDFLTSLYRAIALQVSTSEEPDDTWSAISRRNVGAGVLQQGKRINELPNKKIPIIDFYFDQSGSWTASDIAVGRKAVEELAKMEEDGKIKMNIYYFADSVHTDASSARREGGTGAWNEIVKNVIATGATNVIIMTDSDMESWWNNYWSEQALSYTVPGYVWYLWKYGDNAPRLPRDLKGRGGVQQFSFSPSDV
jgi:hypothetical protein